MAGHRRREIMVWITLIRIVISLTFLLLIIEVEAIERRLDILKEQP